jgi:hypothetical protein
MNLGQAKKKALALMAEYSNDGVIITDGENADYLSGMNSFAHDAQMEISNKVAVEAFVQLNNLTLPTNFKAFRTLFLNGQPFYDFAIRNRQIVTNHTGTFELLYERIPSDINFETKDSYEFEIDQHTHHLIPYYLGGMALADEKESVSSKLLNIYYQMLETLTDYKKQVPYTIQSVDGW